jgi:hypothetical protein
MSITKGILTKIQFDWGLMTKSKASKKLGSGKKTNGGICAGTPLGLCLHIHAIPSSTPSGRHVHTTMPRTAPAGASHSDRRCKEDHLPEPASQQQLPSQQEWEEHSHPHPTPDEVVEASEQVL